MRILMLMPGAEVRGPVAPVATALAAALRGLGCTVVNLPWGRRRDDEEPHDKLSGRSRDIMRVWRAGGARRFDVLLIHSAHDENTLVRDIALALAVRRRFPRIVLQIHGGQPERLNRRGQRPFRVATTLLLRLVDGVLLLSSEEEHAWRRVYPRGDFFVVRNPFVPPREGASPARRGAGAPTLLFVGRLIREKGIHDLIDAMPTVVGRTSCRLLVVGDGPEVGTIRARVAALGLGAHVTLTGYLSGEALVAAYEGATALVLPTFHIEGFPTVILEAMHAGLPIITTPIRGAADHLRDGESALFVTPRDPAALASAIVRLLGDPALQERMANANRAGIGQFAPDIVARDHLDILMRVVNQ